MTRTHEPKKFPALKLSSLVYTYIILFISSHHSYTCKGIILLFNIFFSLRMRRKNWKNPGTVYVDSQVFEQNIQVYASFEVFLEILEGLYIPKLIT